MECCSCDHSWRGRGLTDSEPVPQLREGMRSSAGGKGQIGKTQDGTYTMRLVV